MLPLLINHPKGYSLTLSEGLSSAFLPPLSASTYAARHGECADLLKKEGKAAWGHRTVQVLEYMPVVGLLVAIIERICAFVHRCIYSSVASTDGSKAQTPTDGTPLTPAQEQVVQNILSDKEKDNGNPSNEGQIEDPRIDTNPRIDTPDLENTPPQEEDKDQQEVKPPVTAQSIEKAVELQTTIKVDAINTLLSDTTLDLTDEDKAGLEKEKERQETILGAIKGLSALEQQKKESDQKDLDWAKKEVARFQGYVDQYTEKETKCKERLEDLSAKITAQQLIMTELTTGQQKTYLGEISFDPDDVFTSLSDLDPKLTGEETVLAKDFRGTRIDTLWRIDAKFELTSTDEKINESLQKNSLSLKRIYNNYDPTEQAVVEGENYSILLAGTNVNRRGINYRVQTQFNGDGVLPFVRVYYMEDRTDLNEAAINNLDWDIRRNEAEKDKLLKELEGISQNLQDKLTSLESEKKKVEDLEAKLK